MKKMGLEARTGEGAHSVFPFDPQALDKKRAEGMYILFLFSSPPHLFTPCHPLQICSFIQPALLYVLTSTRPQVTPPPSKARNSAWLGLRRRIRGYSRRGVCSNSCGIIGKARSYSRGYRAWRTRYWRWRIRWMVLLSVIMVRFFPYELCYPNIVLDLG